MKATNKQKLRKAKGTTQKKQPGQTIEQKTKKQQQRRTNFKINSKQQQANTKINKKQQRQSKTHV